MYSIIGLYRSLLRHVITTESSSGFEIYILRFNINAYLNVLNAMAAVYDKSNALEIKTLIYVFVNIFTC